MADQLITSDDCINSDKDIESSYEDIESDNEEVVFIEEQSQAGILTFRKIQK